MDKSIVMILDVEIQKDYNISATKCLDPYRKLIAEKLQNLSVVGPGWNKYLQNKKDCKTIIYDTGHGRLGDLTVLDRIKGYTFNLIIENCNAEGYVSEKIFDSFVAGCIPIYLGNIDENVKKIIPDNCYIDLKNYESVEKLNEYIQNMTNEDILTYKKNINEKRIEIISKVSTDRYLEAVDECINLINY